MCISCHIVFSPRKPSLWSPVATMAPAQRGGGRTACPCVSPLSTGPHQPCEGCQELQQHGLEPRGGQDPSCLPSSLAVATTLWLDTGHRPSQACLWPLVEVPACARHRLPAVPLRHSLQEKQAAPAAGCPRSKGFPRIMPCMLGVALQVQKDIWDAVAPKKNK